MGFQQTGFPQTRQRVIAFHTPLADENPDAAQAEPAEKVYRDPMLQSLDPKGESRCPAGGRMGAVRVAVSLPPGVRLARCESGLTRDM